MRRKNRFNSSDNKKTYLYVLGSVIGVAIIVSIATLVLYGGSSTDDDISKFSTAKIENLVPNVVTANETEKTEQASNPIGKTVKEAEQSAEQKEKEDKKESSQIKSKNTEIENVVTTNNKPEENTNNTPNTSAEKSEDKAPVFIKPVEGEIIKEYAKDKLVYSDTLKEWITHPGIDIKAEKTSIVKCSADGRVSSIKNDPRYGLTVIVEHPNGYKTVYSNLLTAEFVTPGEEIVAGQTIGTVGNTATFEVLDEDHLHFEILKDNENIDPSIYMQ